MHKQTKAYIYALAAVFFWSTVATAFKIALKHLNFIQLLFISTLISTLVLGIILLLQKKAGLLLQSRMSQILLSALFGLLNPFLYYLVLFKAYDLLPAQQALTLNYTWAVMLAVLSVPLLKQKLSLRLGIAAILGFSGVVVIASKGDITSLNYENQAGVLLALGSSVIWALFWIFNLKDERDNTVKLFMNFIFGFIYITITMLFIPGSFDFNVDGFAPAVYIGLFEMGITFIFWLKALSLSKTIARVSNLIYLSPFLSLLLINIVLGEEILTSTFVGLILIIFGILIQREKNH